MWVKQGERETCQWKHGKIIITEEIIRIPHGAILITTDPFLAENSSTLVVHTSSQEDKNWLKVEEILFFFVEQKVTRHSVVYVRGGGILLDLCGFACVIYMRGIARVIFIPTTLLAMVDATVGGKNGINFAHSKNLLGTFAQPTEIIINTSYLDTLSQRHFLNGMAEVIKMAIVYDKDFFLMLESIHWEKIRGNALRDCLKLIIKRSLQLKIAVVQADEYEKHQRKWLNFGHTIGHGLELNTDNTLLHGECVAIGMVCALRLANYLKILKNQQSIDRLVLLLTAIRLPTELPKKLNSDDVMKSMLKDKKKSSPSQHIDFVLIHDIGEKCSQPTKVHKQLVHMFLSHSVCIRYQPIDPQINHKYLFPGSKSISLRLVYMCALAHLLSRRRATITNFLASEDTACMLTSLTGLGFNFEQCPQKRTVTLLSYTPRSEGVLDVGNSGITARFILPLCASLPGRWTLHCHPRMSSRPNKEIISLCLTQLKCNITFLGQQYCFPLIVTTTIASSFAEQLKIDGTLSSQFASSVMIFTGFTSPRTTIRMQQGIIVSQSYIRMTAACLKLFRVQVQVQNNTIHIESSQLTNKDHFEVETDLSTLSYPYVFALLHGIAPPSLPGQSIQGDTLFYTYLSTLANGLYQPKTLRLDFNDCTDTFMSICMFLFSPQVQNSQLESVILYNIANQRVKQSNRIDLLIRNLRKVGMIVHEADNQIRVEKKIHSQIADKGFIIFETAGDHRLAMCFGILATFLSKTNPENTYVIDNKYAVDKTFPDFWSYLSQSGIGLAAPPDLSQMYNTARIPSCNSRKSFILVGQRGAAKTTLGRQLAKKLDYAAVDLDELVTEQIVSKYHLASIAELIEQHGWPEFRNLQSALLQQVICSQQHTNRPLVVITGGGVVEQEINRTTIKRSISQVIYLERKFEDLRIIYNDSRPAINDFKQVAAKRSFIYEQVASKIVTMPSSLDADQEARYFFSCLDAMRPTQLQQGYILCLQDVPQALQQVTDQPQAYSAVQFRIDKMLAKGDALSNIRQKIASFRLNNAIGTILTLRSKSQLGLFEGDYLKFIDHIRKIPTEFIDHEFRQPICYPQDFSKLVVSYHGNQMQTVRKLINWMPFEGIKKWCYQSEQNYGESMSKLALQMPLKSICVDLSNPLTRLKNKYKMVVPHEQDGPNPTGICTLSQMRALGFLVKHVR